jgi:hypothetical protein
MSTKHPSKRSKGRRFGRTTRAYAPSTFQCVPDLDNSLSMRKKIRYSRLGSGGITITNQQFADFLAINVDTNPADTYRFALAVRIIKISLYAAPSVSVNTTLIGSMPRSLQWISSVASAPFGGPAKMMSCTPLSPTNAVVHSRPPPESYAAQWINCQNNVTAGAVDLVTIISYPGDIIDITYEFVVNTSSTLTATSQTVATLYGTVQPPVYALTFGGNPSTGLTAQEFSSYF